jgi:hypothetical protein
MGGLMARLQTINSADQFWRTVSDQPLANIKAPEELRKELGETFFFGASPSVRRVVTMGTPYRGSEFSNSTTRWIATKLIKLPKMFVDSRQQLYAENPETFKDPSVMDVETSIDSLAPDSPFLPVMLQAQPAPWVHFHTIIGVIPEKGLVGKFVGEGDGVVAYSSAHLDHVDSEIVVNADHTTVHSHPLSVLEVHRILLAHLADVDRRLRPDMWQRAPMTAQVPGNHWSPDRPVGPSTYPLPDAAPAGGPLGPQAVAPLQPTYPVTMGPSPDGANIAWPPSPAASIPPETPRTPLFGAPPQAY